MSDYTKSTNFASKDSLISGNPLKIVKGAELDTEFNNIATAIATKTDNASAAITGGSITGITDLAVADGGTGASTAADARTNLGAAKSGANNDITSLSGLTTALSVAQGGTGATSLTSGSILKGAGTSAITTASASDIVSAIGSTAVAKATDVTNGLGVGQTYQNVTSSRSFGTTYTNSTGKPIWVWYSSTDPVAGSASGYVDGNLACFTNMDTYPRLFLGFIVPSGSTYSITTSGNKAYWLELR